jgi:hypothetical protein
MTSTTLKRVSTRDEFVAAIADSDGQAATHLFLLCPFRDVEDLVSLFAERDSLYSIFARQDTVELRSAAGQITTVPIFLVPSEAEAVDTARRLVESPHVTVREAINGAAVAARFLQGNAS